MKNSKLLKLQKKYKPERLMNLSGNKAILSDRLYIPNKYISDEMLEAEYGDDIEVEKKIKGYKEYKNCTAFQRGDLAKMDVVFATELADTKVKFLDIRAKPKMVNNIRFTGKLKKDHERVCRE